MEELKIGDLVKYSTKFLRSISCYSGSLPFAKGKITEINGYLATVEWNDPYVPNKVNINNLVPANKTELD